MAIDTIFLDSGVLRAYIDRRDRVHEKCFAMIHDYLDLHCVYSTTTLNISELSFWLDKTRMRYVMESGELGAFANRVDLDVFDAGAEFSAEIFQEWINFCQKFQMNIDFTDFYLYSAALLKQCDYIMTTDKRDFGKLLALAPTISFPAGTKIRAPFTHDDIIFI